MPLNDNRLLGELSAAVGWLQLTYTTQFNGRHRRSGHLFQGRFKAVLVEADEYGRGFVAVKQGLEEARWTTRPAAGGLRERVRELVAGEANDQVKIWARVKLGGDRPVEVAKEYGYRHQSGGGQVMRRLEDYAKDDGDLRRKLEHLQAQVLSCGD